jgi:hypothetical protein
VHVKSGQAVIAAFHEKDVDNYGEEDALIIWNRCHKNLEKTREQS